MNFRQPLYGRITIGNEQVSLGRAELPVMAERMIRELVKPNKPRGSARAFIELSQEPITGDIDPIKKLEMEFQPEFDSRDTEVAPGITLGMVADACTQPQYTRWNLISTDPVKRAVMSVDEINAAREEFDSQYPGYRLAGFPPWND